MGEMMHSEEFVVADYQNYMEGIFNFPMKHTIHDVFGKQRISMTALSYKMMNSKHLYKDYDALGLFVDNHDEARFLSKHRDPIMFNNALIFSLTSQGIPFVYQGSEHLFRGGDDPANRESLW
jgi:alpha-amylase